MCWIWFSDDNSCAATDTGWVKGWSFHQRKKKEEKCCSLEQPSQNDDREDLVSRIKAVNPLFCDSDNSLLSFVPNGSLLYQVMARSMHTEHGNLFDFTGHVFTLNTFIFHWSGHPHFPLTILLTLSSVHSLNMHLEYKILRCSDKTEGPSVCDLHSSFKHCIKIH